MWIVRYFVLESVSDLPGSYSNIDEFIVVNNKDFYDLIEGVTNVNSLFV